jgi:hypothetical protein
MKRIILFVLAILGIGLLFAVFAVRTAERTSKHEHDWRLAHGRGLGE